MDDVSSNKVNMIGSTLSFCKNNLTPTAGIMAFNGIRIQGEDKLVLIRALALVGEGGTKGTTSNTLELRGVVERLTYKCGNGVAAWAYSVGKLELEAANSHNKSDIERMKKEVMVSVGTQVHTDALANVLLAAPYGYTSTDVNDLGVALGLYEAKIQSPQEMKATINSSKTEMKRMIGDLIETIFVKQMDRMVNTLIDSQKVFYKAYATVRGINDLGGHHGKIGGTTVDINDSALDGVVFTAVKHDTTTVIGTETSADGGKFSEKDMLPQNLDLTWVLAGFHTVTKLNVHLGPGKSLRYHITMLPIVP